MVAIGPQIACQSHLRDIAPSKISWEARISPVFYVMYLLGNNALEVNHDNVTIKSQIIDMLTRSTQSQLNEVHTNLELYGCHMGYHYRFAEMCFNWDGGFQ